MSERFFVETPIHGPTAQLSGQEAQHLSKVLRARVGDDVQLFDGSGAEFSATIADLQRNGVTLKIRERREVSREAVGTLTLAVAIPKGDRQRVLVEKLTELGVTRMIPLITERAVVQPDADTVERLQRFVIEASKQCGRNRLLAIAAPLCWTDLVLSAPTAAVRMIAHPTTPSLGAASDTIAVLDQESLLVAVGPEGGFTDAEVAAGETAGWQRLGLGPRILRMETAAIAVAALWSLRPSRHHSNFHESRDS